MAAIDLIVLGMLKQEALSAYDMQKLVEYRQISKWVKISTPSIYKKVIQLEEKGFVKSLIEKTGNMPEKAVYSLTSKGEEEFERLMLEISTKSVNIYLDFNAVIVNLSSLSPDKQQICLSGIETNIKQLKACQEINLLEKENMPDIPETGKAVLQQQFMLTQAIENWITALKAHFQAGDMPSP